MEQAANRENMTQNEVDALVRRIESGDAAFGMPATLDVVELNRKTKANYRQLEYAIKRCEVEILANVRNEERPARFAQVHYYAHWNWLFKRGFTNKKDFWAFMDRKARERGVTLNWGGRL